MKATLLTFAFPFFVLLCAVAADETRIVTSRVGADTYEFDLNPETLKKSAWDFTKQDQVPISPRQAQDLATRALYELRPKSEDWKVWMRSLEISDTWAVYNIGFHLKDPETGRYSSNLLFIITMSGEVLTPRPAKESNR